VSESPAQPPSPRSQRILRAALPVGLVLLLAWVGWVVVEIAVGDAQRGSWWVSAAIGLTTCLILIASGISYRRALRRL
jgi:uncharacterized membrane protein